MAKSQLRGSQKKLQKSLGKLEKEYKTEQVKDLKRERHFKRGARRELEDISHGKHLPKYRPEAEYKAKAKYKPEAEYKHKSLHQLTKDFERAGRGAEKIYQPIKENAIAEFNQNTRPQIAAQFAGGSGGSSAMNQALAAAQGNLQQRIASDFAGLQTQLAGNLLGAKENQRFNAANFLNQQEQYGSQLRNQQEQFGSQFRENQNQFQNQSDLQRLQSRMQSNSLLLGQSFQPQFAGTLSSPYMQKSGGGTSGLGGPLISGGLSALGSYASSEAGAAGLTSLFSSSQDVKENIREYDKGLEIIRDLDVKQYDYTIDVPGRKNDRVGLIAETLPEEIQGMIGDIKAVDIYGLVALLVNCVKQLDEKVQMLESR